MARLVDTSIPDADYGSPSFEIKGREFDLEAASTADLEVLDWPSTVTAISFYKSNDTARLSLAIDKVFGWRGYTRVSGPDAIWVRGVAAQFRDLFERSKSVNGVLTRWFVVLPCPIIATAALGGAWTLGLLALGASGDAGRLVISVGIFVIINVGVQLAFILPSYLFPHIEFNVGHAKPLHMRLRAWAAGIGAALVIGVVSSLVASAILLLG